VTLNITARPHLHQDWVDQHAVGIVRALQKNGYKTYLVGGCVRDLLLGIHPKDFDIATNARPEQVRKVIHRAYVIGKRFRLVLVRREEMQFEVATFRREIRDGENPEDLPEGDNIFGSAEEDARRRDFTINGLFYDPINDELIDFAEGLPDLESGVVRMIGDPNKRLMEDPIRILRALRLKHMIGFCLDTDLRRAMQEFAHTLPSTVLPRRREEILKLLRLRSPALAFREAQDMGILKFIAPTLDEALLADLDSAENFYNYLGQIPYPSSLGPGELFAHLVHAFFRSFEQADPAAGLKVHGLKDSDRMQVWMRDELGMFKHEQTLVLKALHVEPLLARRAEFQKRGERRQIALLVNEAFPMAFRFAQLDCFLNCEDLLYWLERSSKVKSERPSGGGGGDNGRRRRRGRRRPRKGTDGAPATEVRT
jgi:poly(A) polymerase